MMSGTFLTTVSFLVALTTLGIEANAVNSNSPSNQTLPRMTVDPSAVKNQVRNIETIQAVQSEAKDLQGHRRTKESISNKLGSMLSDLADAPPLNTRIGDTLSSALTIADGKVLVDVVGNTIDNLEAALVSAGFEVINCYGHQCSAFIPISRLSEFETMNEVQFLRPSMAISQLVLCQISSQTKFWQLPTRWVQ